MAETLLAEVTFVSAQVAPVQSPPKALNEYPGLAVAVHVLLPPWFTGLGLQDTVPPAVGTAPAVTA